MIKRLFGSVLILLLLLLAGSVHGEISSVNASGIPNRPLSVDPTGKTEGFSAILYNNPNGLPTSEANAITETEEGFIWIGSYAGLIRYDGNTFERFDSTTGIANVRCLLVDSRNRLWIGTNDSGVYLMTKGQLQSWDKGDGLQSSSIRAIEEDPDGNILVGSAAGMAVINPELKMTDLNDERIAQLTIKEIRRGTGSLLYGLTTTGDLFTLKDCIITSFISSSELPAEGVLSILPDPENPGYLYLHRPPA